MLFLFIHKIRYKLDGWKTVIINTLIALPSSVLYLYSEFGGVDISSLLPTKYAAAILALLGVMGICLRIATDGGIGQKGIPDYSPTDTKEDA